MRDLYFNQSNDEVPLSKTYGIKKQRFEVLSVFDSYYLFSACPERDSNLGPSKIAVFEDRKATALTTQQHGWIGHTLFMSRKLAYGARGSRSIPDV